MKYEVDYDQVITAILIKLGAQPGDGDRLSFTRNGKKESARLILAHRNAGRLVIEQDEWAEMLKSWLAERIDHLDFSKSEVTLRFKEDRTIFNVLLKNVEVRNGN